MYMSSNHTNSHYIYCAYSDLMILQIKIYFQHFNQPHKHCIPDCCKYSPNIQCKIQSLSPHTTHLNSWFDLSDTHIAQSHYPNIDYVRTLNISIVTQLLRMHHVSSTSPKLVHICFALFWGINLHSMQCIFVHPMV